MRNFQLPFSMVSLCTGVVAVLGVTYIGLIAAVMSYAALTVEFSQSVKNDEASVGVLESQYLANLSTIENTNYIADGYTAPIAQVFVPAQMATAMR